MTPVVVDTDVASFVFKDHALAAAYKDILVDKDLSISFMTLAELRAGAAKANWGARRRALLDRYLSAFEVLHTSDRLCSDWADLSATMETAGRRVESADAWIAATARLLRRPLVTHNRRHFEGILGGDLRLRSSSRAQRSVRAKSTSRGRQYSTPGRVGFWLLSRDRQSIRRHGAAQASLASSRSSGGVEDGRGGFRRRE